VSLTRQLLAFSRRQVFQPRVIAVHRLVQEARQTLTALVGHAIELRLELPESLPDISADPSQLRDVIVNLVLNARDAMPKGGVLTIRVDKMQAEGRPSRERPWIRVGSYVRITISDTGAGVDAIMKAHVFEPFFTTKQLGNGSGLGLATVYGIVKQSNGYIWLESEVGHGAAFTVLLPILETAPGQAPFSTPAVPAFETILVVEEDESIRRLLADALRHRGYEVLEAASAGGATEAFTTYSGRIHLLLTEVSLGADSGREIARRLKAAEPLLQVMYMSGSTSPSSDHAPILGMPFIQKPFSLQALAAKVRQVLDTGEGRG
jgi:two-component system cell cycle sensor histidine kinase/response regulator CckA